MQSDEHRYESYVRWSSSVGAPTQLTFEQWARKSSATLGEQEAERRKTAVLGNPDTGEPCQQPECLYQGKCVCDGDN